MKQRPRIYYTESQKALMWERWQKGESLQQIAQLFDRNHSSIEGILAETGGIARCYIGRNTGVDGVTLAFNQINKPARHHAPFFQSLEAHRIGMA